ncbi:importin subunit beta-1-like [Pyrus ussuriensis x Pyrus communis]|uniref:Importin subunit beta-1-like n=1 Tax=Pyrus ussuriensis x Pyrus communis TaxID=2448454 RepID=A0A5N5F6G4_9ROSA|nr:importin subunit beta-1-like [Pyrus ussuriensis x Pyrus communis]
MPPQFAAFNRNKLRKGGHDPKKNMITCSPSKSRRKNIVCLSKRDRCNVGFAFPRVHGDAQTSGEPEVVSLAKEILWNMN